MNVLPFVTTIHLALAALGHHRRSAGRRIDVLGLLSLMFAASPWIFSTPAGIAAGLAAHAIWFVVCERLVARERGGTPTSSRPRHFVETPVLAVIDQTADVKTFRLRRPLGFDFVAGQFLTIRIKVNGRDVVRCYSISSSPAARDYLEISVKRQGLVSGALHATVQTASKIAVRPPAGAFCYPSDSRRPMLLLAGGIGITPLLSMIRHAVAHEPARPVTLVYSAKDPGAFAFRDELVDVAARHRQIKIVLASRGAAALDVYPGRIDETLLRAVVPDLAGSVALICGPQPMIDGMRELLSRLGLPPSEIRFEIFEAAVAGSGGRRVAGDANEPAHQVKYARTQRTHAVAAGQTLLEAAEDAGVPMDSLCRAGVCGTCRTKVLDGRVECASMVLDAGEREQGYVLACVSHVRSDCVVDA